MARKGSTSKVDKGVSTKGKSSSAVAKCKKKLAHSAAKEPQSPDPPTSDSDDSVQPIEIYKGSPARIEYPRPAKRKRKTPEPAAIPAKRRKVTKTSEHTVKKTKTTTPQRSFSKGAIEKECVEISSHVESTESYNESASAGSPANDQPLRESTRQPSYPLRSHAKRIFNDSAYPSSPPTAPRQSSLPRRGQIKLKTQLGKTKISRPLYQLSRSSQERELYDVSSVIERAEGSDASDYAGPPASDRLSRSSHEEHSQPQSQFDDSSLYTGGLEQSGTSQNLSITQETKASSVTPALSPYPAPQYISLPRFEWETSDILKVIPVDTKPTRLEAICCSSNGTRQSILLDDLIDRCPRKVALYFQKAVIERYQAEKTRGKG